jgi:CspA family cold shock protein
MVEQGHVKWFNNRAGWGFISRTQGPDVFVRHDRIVGDGYKSLRPGDRVEFTVRRGRRGPYAIGVTVIAAAEKVDSRQTHANAVEAPAPAS